jgi:hypothetical protein
MLTGPTAFPVLGGLLVEAVLARFRANSVVTPPVAGVVPAPIVWDNCDCLEGGQLSVAVTRIAPSVNGQIESFGGDTGTGGPPIPTAAMPTPRFLLGELQVAVLRCADASGDPSSETLAREAAQVHADAYWTTLAVVCELKRLREADEIEDYQLRDQPFLPAAGGCQGAQVNAAVAINFSCPCG